MKKPNKISQILRIAVGGVLALVGFVGMAVGILAVLDPVGAQHSNDGNPFGPPPTTLESVLIAALFLCVAASGVFLIIGLKRLKCYLLGAPTTP